MRRRFAGVLVATFLLSACSTQPSQQEVLTALQDAGVDTAPIVADYPKFERAMAGVCERPDSLARVTRAQYPTHTEDLFTVYRVWARQHCPDEVKLFKS